VTTILLPPDPDTLVASALRWACRGDLDMATKYLAKLDPTQLAQARMHLLRLALLILSMSPEGVAMAALSPDALPDGVDGHSVTGRLT
jgi:hypothetical protein